ncbi:MAG: DUF2219 domain-containing protein [Parcubacteria group bacterium]
MGRSAVGALIVAMAATVAHAQQPPVSRLSAAVFDTGKATPTQWRTAQFAGAQKDTRINLDVTGSVTDASGRAPLAPSDEASFEPKGFDLRLSRDWPDAVSVGAGDQKLSVTPHAGVGLTDAGPGAEAGATVSVEDRVAGRLEGIGVRDGKSFGDKGRWYMFVAGGSRTVGLNMLRGADGGLQRAGWSTDATSALVSDAQAGVGWRRGAMQASIGYMHREVKPHEPVAGFEKRDDNLVAISFSFKPR